MGQSLSDSGSSYGIDGPRLARRTEPARMADAAAVGLPRFRPLPARRAGRDPGRGGRAARRPGEGLGTSVLRLNSQDRGAGRGVPEIAGRTVGGGRAGDGAGGRDGVDADQKAWRGPRPWSTRRREWAVARDEQQFREAQERKRAQEAAKRARVQIPLARSLERMGKITGALAFYQDIARDASGTDEGRLAAAKVSALIARKEAGK